jgi:hypothetical protein
MITFIYLVFRMLFMSYGQNESVNLNIDALSKNSSDIMFKVKEKRKHYEK